MLPRPQVPPQSASQVSPPQPQPAVSDATHESTPGDKPDSDPDCASDKSGFGVIGQSRSRNNSKGKHSSTIVMEYGIHLIFGIRDR